MPDRELMAGRTVRVAEVEDRAYVFEEVGAARPRRFRVSFDERPTVVGLRSRGSMFEVAFVAGKPRDGEWRGRPVSFVELEEAGG